MCHDKLSNSFHVVPVPTQSTNANFRLPSVKLVRSCPRRSSIIRLLTFISGKQCPGINALCLIDTTKECGGDANSRLPYPAAQKPFPLTFGFTLQDLCGQAQCADQKTYCDALAKRGKEDPGNCAATTVGQSTEVFAGDQFPWQGSTHSVPSTVKPHLAEICGQSLSCASQADYCAKLKQYNDVHKNDPQFLPLSDGANCDGALSDTAAVAKTCPFTANNRNLYATPVDQEVLKICCTPRESCPEAIEPGCGCQNCKDPKLPDKCDPIPAF